MTSADKLILAAAVSIMEPTDFNAPTDPLRRLIPGDGPVIEDGLLETVEAITGRRPHLVADGGNVVNTAPWARSALRRWAAQQDDPWS